MGLLTDTRLLDSIASCLCLGTSIFVLDFRYISLPCPVALHNYILPSLSTTFPLAFMKVFRILLLMSE
jgi:hypothetical protein